MKDSNSDTASCGSNERITALLMAGCRVVVEVVLTTGCHLNAAGNDHYITLCVSAVKGKRGTEGTVLKLIRHGTEKTIATGARGTPIHLPIVDGHVSTVMGMLMAGRCVFVGTSNGGSVSDFVAAEVVREVLSTGCDMNAATNDGRTPLHVASVKGNTEAALELIRHGTEKAIVAGAFGTTLHQAAGGGHVSTVKAKLETDCPVDVVDSNGCSVLHAATAGGNAEVVREVLSTGCDMNATANDCGTPLHVAALVGYTEAALELIRHGTEKAIVAGAFGTALHQTAEGGHVSTVKGMLKVGCLVDVVDVDGSSAFHIAAGVGNADMVGVVLTTGCHINAAGFDHDTPLCVSAVKGNRDAVLEIIRHRTSKATVAGTRGTSFHQAALCGHVSTVEDILKVGCLVDVVDIDGLDAVHIAAGVGNNKVVMEMLSACVPLVPLCFAFDSNISLDVARNVALQTIRLAEVAIVTNAGCCHVSSVKEMLKAGCPVCVAASDGLNTSHFATGDGNNEVVREILSTGCEIDAVDDGGRTPLRAVAHNRNSEAASEWTLSVGGNVVAGASGTPLHQANLFDPVSTVKSLLKSGCSMDVVDSNGCVVSHSADADSKAELIGKLLIAGSDINAAGNYNCEPLADVKLDGDNKMICRCDIQTAHHICSHLQEYPIHSLAIDVMLPFDFKTFDEFEICDPVYPIALSQCSHAQEEQEITCDDGIIVPKRVTLSLVHEEVLDNVCFSFELNTLCMTSTGGVFTLEPHGINIEVPPGAVSPSESVDLRCAVIVDGPFTLPEGYQLGSMVVYLYYDGRRLTKPITLSLPHWYGGEDQVRDGLTFAMAPHTLKEGENSYRFQLLEGGRFKERDTIGSLQIDGHSTLFTIVFNQKAISRYLASFWQNKENGTHYRAAITYDCSTWLEVCDSGVLVPVVLLVP